MKCCKLGYVRAADFYASIKSDHHRAEALLALLGFVFFATAFYPGFMSPDSLQQYQQSLSLNFSDWHPPIMSWLWSKLNLVSDGPQNLLILQLSMLWGGLYLFSKNLDHGRYKILYILVGFSPWIANFEGVLWKDVEMAYALLLALAILSSNKLNKYKIFVASILLMYAFMVRGNAPAALPPVIWYAMEKIFPMLSNRIKIFATTLTIILMFAFSNAFNYHVLDADQTHPESYMMIDDLVHLSAFTDKSLLPGVSLAILRECSNKTIGGTKLVGKSLCLSTNPEYKIDSWFKIKQAWISAVENNPFEYIKFRLEAYLYLLRSPSLNPYYYWHPGINTNNLGLSHDDNFATKILQKYINTTAQSAPFIFKPYWWLACALFIMAATFLTQGSRDSIILIRVLLTSAILYMMSYIPLTPMADFRYVYWSTLAISLSGITFITSKLKPSKRRIFGFH